MADNKLKMEKPDELSKEKTKEEMEELKLDDDPYNNVDLNEGNTKGAEKEKENIIVQTPKNENDNVSGGEIGSHDGNKGEEKGKEVDNVVEEHSSKFKKSVRWSEDLVSESPSPRRSYSGMAPPYNEDRGYYGEHGQSSSHVDSFSHPSINFSAAELKSKVESVKGALGRWSKRVGEATRKAEDLAGNTWQHLKMGPSFTDAALGRIAQSTKVLAEGGYEKIFQQTFETIPGESLRNAFACYLSTSVGPVMGVLYVSTEKLAYSSDNPLSYNDNDSTEWDYYKVTIPLHQLKEVNPSSSSSNSAEKYIQVVSAGSQEFWFMGFLNYSVALDLLKEVLEAHSVQPS